MFKPKLDILSAAQAALWSNLGQTPEHFVLYGGTALALRLGHRKSIDFDFFSSEPVDPDYLFSSVTYLKEHQVLNISPNTLDVLIQTEHGAVKVSFFGGLSLKQIAPPDITVDNMIAIASMKDIFGMKCATVPARTELKDYLDIHALINMGNLPLPTGIGAAKAIYGNQYNPVNTLKALCYFDDLPDGLDAAHKQDLMNAVQSVDLSKIPVIETVGHIGASLSENE